MAGQRQWTEAYVGEGGLNVLMCTYSIPVTDKSGRTVGVLFADVTMEDATVMMSKLNHGIRKSGIVTVGIQIVSFLLLSFIIWRSVVASRRYKARYIDPEKNHLIEQVEKMRQVNTRLTKRNQELAQRVAEMQARLNSQVQQRTDQHWFG
jgi:hypothetical protein